MEFGSFSQNCGKASEPAVQTQRTKPLIPEMCFTTTGCSTDINLSTPYLEEDGTSMLVSCKKCSVRVHASEYLSPFPPVPAAGPACWKLLTPIGLPSLLQRRTLMDSWEVGCWWMSFLVVPASIPKACQLWSPLGCGYLGSSPWLLTGEIACESTLSDFPGF